MNMETISIVFCILVILGLGIILYKKMDTSENFSADQNSIEKETTNNLEQFGSSLPICNYLKLAEFFTNPVLNLGKFIPSIAGWTIQGSGGVQRLTEAACSDLISQGGNGQTGYLESPLSTSTSTSLIKLKAGVINPGAYLVLGKIIYRTDRSCNLLYRVSFISGNNNIKFLDNRLTYDFNTKKVTSTNSGNLNLSVIILPTSKYINTNFSIKIELLPGSSGQANFNNIIVTGPGLCPTTPTTSTMAPTTTPMPPTTSRPTTMPAQTTTMAPPTTTTTTTTPIIMGPTTMPAQTTTIPIIMGPTTQSPTIMEPPAKIPPTERECVLKTIKMMCPNNKNAYTELMDCNGYTISSDYVIKCIDIPITEIPPTTTLPTIMEPPAKIPPTERECVLKTIKMMCPNNKNAYTEVMDCNGYTISSNYNINCIDNVATFNY
jgi:hypothetical protein